MLCCYLLGDWSQPRGTSWSRPSHNAFKQLYLDMFNIIQQLKIGQCFVYEFYIN